jgi:hypothetical protein
MIDATQFRRLEQVSKFTCPASFLAWLDQFGDLSTKPAFGTLFVRWTVCSESDIRKARHDGLPDDLIPFFMEPQGTHNDYYCFDTNDDSVVVYADHAIVFRWTDFAEFLAWIRTKIGV